MYRKAYRDLLKWKDSVKRKPLVLLGARQVGKTWLMREFGRNEFDNVVYINCDTEPLMKNLFQKDYDVARLLLGFQAITGESIREGSTLIVLDEIQEAPRGLHALKYFCENARGYHVVAAGSLLGVTLAQKESFPVGKVDMMHIYPMDFEEFLLACGQEGLCGILRDGDYSLVATFAGRLADYLRRYYYVGGMPEAVLSFVEDANLNVVRKIQHGILGAYRRDISKHSSKTEAVRIGLVLDSLPSQLAKENRKFIYGVARPGGRAADFELAIQWLMDAGLIYKVNRVAKIALPLKFYEESSSFKIFLLDVGLLGCMADVPASVILDSGEISGEYRGMLAEEYAAQQLVACGLTPYYWSNDRTPAEIDFVIQRDDRVYPVEVKSGVNVRGKSISQYISNNPGLHGLRFSLLDYRRQDVITNYPLYSIPFLFNTKI